MDKPDKQTRKHTSDEPENEPPSEEKGHDMENSNSDSKISLSCWWSRGPSGQVQEWESRPTTTQRALRSGSERRTSSSQWESNSRKSRKSKT